jgi:hypothetical protein
MTEPTITVPPATLFSRFRAISALLSSQNGVLLAGSAYVPHDLAYMGIYTGASLATAWPALGVGETPVTSTATVRLVNAIVRFYQETGAPSAAKGTWYSVGNSPNKLTHNGAATVWTGAGFTPALNVPLAVGDYVRIDDNGSTILHTRVTGFQAISGSMKVLILADSIPAALRGPGIYFNVSVGQVADVDLTNAQLTTSPTLLTVPASLTAATTRTGSAYPVTGATLPNGQILGGAYASYRASLAGAFTNTVVKLYTQADVDALFPSTAPESGLGFAASQALSPVLGNLTPSPVLVIAPTTETVGAYQALADEIRFRSDYSTMTVLSEDQAIIDVFTLLLEARSLNYTPTQLVVGQTFPRDVEIGSSAIVTINDAQTPLSQRTFSVASGSPFGTAVAGDTIRHYTSPTVYVAYVIESVISGQDATVTTAVPGGPLSNQTIEVWHHLTTPEQVVAAIAQAQSYVNKSVNLIYPDTFTWAGEAVPPYMMAARVAAMRSWSAPQQAMAYALPNLSWSAPSMEAVSGYEGQLASGGLFVFDVSTSGVLYVRYPRTTDQSTEVTANDVIVATEQFSIRYAAAQLLPYLGLYRMSSELYSQLRTVAISACNQLQGAVVDPIGAIIVGYAIGNITRSETNSNVVIVPITLFVAGIAEDVLQLEITVVLE